MTEVGLGHPGGETELGCKCPDRVMGLMISVLLLWGRTPGRVTGMSLSLLDHVSVFLGLSFPIVGTTAREASM